MMRRPPGVPALLVVLCAALALPGTASALRLKLAAGGWDQLTQVTAPRTGGPAGALYVVEQEGQVWLRRSGTRTRFLDIADRVGSGGERGLLSIAFDPRYGRNGLVYVNYTNTRGNTRVVRYRTNADRTRVRRGTARVLLKLRQPFSNHNGGQLAFGPDGRLYTGQGDGGSGCDPAERAQNLRSKHGKLLSMDPRRTGRGWRIDAYGLRNPWRYSFDRTTGRLYIGDVGQDSREEVDTLPARRLGGRPENFLWDAYEGRSASGCEHEGLRGNGKRVWPIGGYGHGGGNCSVTGGFAYRGRAIRWLRGWYLFADFCSGRIWRLLYRDGKVVRGRRLVLDTDLRITSFGENARGELFVAHQDGRVYRLVRG